MEKFFKAISGGLVMTFVMFIVFLGMLTIFFGELEFVWWVFTGEWFHIFQVDDVVTSIW